MKREKVRRERGGGGGSLVLCPFLRSRLSVTPVNWNGVLLRFCPWTTTGNYERIMTTFDELAVRFFRFVRGAIIRVPQVYVGIWHVGFAHVAPCMRIAMPFEETV